MGEPKALVPFRGEEMITHVARALRPACRQLVLSVGPPEAMAATLVDRMETAARIGFGDVPTVVTDTEAFRGPVAGLSAALSAADQDWAFVAGCDSPLLSPTLVSGLLALADDTTDVVLPVRGDQPEPLLAAYRTQTMARHFRRQLRDGAGSPLARLDDVRVRRVIDRELLALDPTEESFLNVNARGDLTRAEGRARS